MSTHLSEWYITTLQKSHKEGTANIQEIPSILCANFLMIGDQANGISLRHLCQNVEENLKPRSNTKAEQDPRFLTLCRKTSRLLNKKGEPIAQYQNLWYREVDLIHGGNESYAVGDGHTIADFETCSEPP